MKVLLTHPGTQYAPQLAAQLYRQGILYKYVTGLGFSNDPGPVRRVSERLPPLGRIIKRRWVDIPAAAMHRIVWPDAWSLYRMRRGHRRDDIFLKSNGWFQQLIPEQLLQETDLVIGFDTCSWILAERCRQINKPYIQDISIGHPLSKERVFTTIRQRFPAWAQELAPKSPRNMEVELAEMQLATHFVAASQFTRQTYMEQGISASRISVNRYGTALDFFHPKKTAGAAGQPLTFLYFSKLSARKGFPWLCEVWEQFYRANPGTKLLAAGYGKLPEGFKIPAGMEIRGFVHPSERLRLFHEADVFVFPSFFEGFGQVIIEAMACGLPVITTTHTVGPELIENAAEGFVIEPGNDTALLQALTFFSDHRQLVQPMGRTAWQKVQAYTWENYGRQWKQILQRLFETT